MHHRFLGLLVLGILHSPQLRAQSAVADDSLAIQRVYDQFARAHTILNTDSALTCYTSEGLRILFTDRGATLYAGMTDLRRFFADNFNAWRQNGRQARLSFRFQRRDIRGNVAYDRGISRFELGTPGRPGYISYAWIVAELTRGTDGRWRFRSEGSRGGASEADWEALR